MKQNGQQPSFADLWKGLHALKEGQLPLLEHLGHDNLEPDTLARYGTALSIEVSEFINETPWKVWKPGFQPDRAKIIEEFADVLAFLGSWLDLLALMDITPAELTLAYLLKREKNIARLTGTSGEEGYTGVPGSLSEIVEETITHIDNQLEENNS